MADEKLVISIETQANARSLSSFNKELRGTENLIKTLDKSLKTNGTSYDQLSNKLTALNNKLSTQRSMYTKYQQDLAKTSKAMEDNRRQYDELSKAGGDNAKQLDTLDKKYAQLQGTYNTTASKMKTLEVEMKNTAQAAQEVTKQLDNFGRLQLSQKLQEWGDKTKQLGQGLQNIGNSLSGFGSKVLTAFTPIDTALVGCSKSFMTFEEGVAKVSTLVDTAKYSMEDYSRAILELSNNTGTGVNDLTEATYQALSAGVEYAESTEFINQANKLAVGGFTDSASAVDILTTAINAYGLSTEETEHLSSVLINTQNLGKTTVNELASALGDVIPNAKNLGVSFEELNTGMVMLTKQGISTSESATALKSLFRELGDSGSAVGKILQEQTGKSFTELVNEGKNVQDVLKILDEYAKNNGTSFNELFGRAEALKGALGLLNENAGDYTAILKDMNSATGYVGEAFDKVASTDAFKFKKALNELKNSFVSVGQSLTPFIKEFSEGMSEVAKFISNLSEEQVQSIAKFALWGTAIGASSKILGGIISPIGKLIGKFGELTTGLGKIIAPSASAATALQGVGTASLGVSTASASGASAISTFIGAMNPMVAVAGGVALAIGGLTAAYLLNQQELDRNSGKLQEAAKDLDDFEGRVRSTGSWIEKTFGKEVKIKFSAEFQEGREQIQQEYDGMLEQLKTYYEKKWEIDHDGCEDESEHQKHRQELRSNEQKELFKSLMQNRQDLSEHQGQVLQEIGNFLSETYGLDSLAIGEQQSKMSNWLTEKCNLVSQNEQEVYNIQKAAYEQNRELTAEEQEKIKTLQEESGKWRALIEKGTAEDIYNAWELEYMQEQNLLVESERKRKEYCNNIQDAMWNSNKNICKSIDEQIEKIKEADWLDEETKQEQIKRLEGQKRAVSDFTEVYGRRTQQNIDSGDNFAIASQKAFASIVSDLQSGKINAQDFGMTQEEYMAMALEGMLEAGAGADELTAAIAEIPEERRAEVLSKIQGKSDAEALKKAIDNINNKDVYVTTYYQTRGLNSNTQKGYGYKNGQAGYWEQGTHGRLGSEQLGYINEKTRKSRGWELVDGPYAFLGSDSIGDKVLLGQGAAVTNNLTSTAMMMKAVQEEVASSINKLDFSSYSTPNSSRSRALQGTTIIKSPGTNLAGLEAKVDNVTTTLATLLNILINTVEDKDSNIYMDSRKVSQQLAPYMDIELQRRKNRR